MSILVINEYGKDTREFRVTQDEVQIGRDPRGDIVLADDGVSRRHARIVKNDDEFLVEDLQSRNGTLVNDSRLPSGDNRQLSSGDRIQLGRTLIKFLLESRGWTSRRHRKEPDASGESASLPGTGNIRQQEPISLFSLRKIEAALLIVQEGRPAARYPLAKDRVRIGRKPETDIVLTDPTISGEHAEIVYNQEGFHIVDRDSYWGTFLNGVSVRLGRLAHGSFLRLGKVQALVTVNETGTELEEPPFGLRDLLIESCSDKKEEILEAFRQCREQALDFGEELVARGLLDPEKWWQAIEEFKKKASLKPGSLLRRLFHRQERA